MFNKEFIAAILDLYGAQQLVIDREGKSYAFKPEGQWLIPGLQLDTDSAEERATQERAIAEQHARALEEAQAATDAAIEAAKG